MTNQQLKAHCEDVIANPQDHLDWVVDMARVALASLDAEPVAWVNKSEIALIRPARNRCVESTLWGVQRFDEVPIYTAPPVPEMKPVIVAKDLKVKATSHQSHLDYAEGYNDRAEMDRNAIRAAGYEVKS